jgi:hypothetical protein
MQPRLSAIARQGPVSVGFQWPTQGREVELHHRGDFEKQ